MLFPLRTQQKGFTLIELMVVISIIGTLSSTVLASTNTARMKARDLERISTLHQIQNALEMYYADHGAYPQGLGFSVWDNFPDTPSVVHMNWRNNDPSRPKPMDALINGGYISRISDDPISTETFPAGPYLASGPPDDLGYIYCSVGDGHTSCPTYPTNQTYVLGTNLESGGPSPDRYGNYQLHSN